MPSCRDPVGCSSNCTRPKDENGRCDILMSFREERIRRIRARYGDHGARQEVRKMDEAYSQDNTSTAQNGRPRQ